MANENRLRSNNISGTITDNPLLIGATTINSPGFVDLPVVDATNHLILILDPTEANGAAEIVRVTAHTAAASSLTVIRGSETTTPRQHALGVTWQHGPVASDFLPTPYIVGRVTSSSTQAGVSAEVDITGLTFTVTTVAGHVYRLTGRTNANGSVATTHGYVLLKQDGVEIGRGAQVCPSGNDTTLLAQQVFTPSAGSHVFKATLQCVTGTITTANITSAPAYLILEDLGT